MEAGEQLFQGPQGGPGERGAGFSSGMATGLVRRGQREAAGRQSWWNTVRDCCSGREGGREIRWMLDFSLDDFNQLPVACCRITSVLNGAWQVSPVVPSQTLEVAFGCVITDCAKEMAQGP